MAGLGNPGERFAATRHNVGARVVEALADRLGVRLRKIRFTQADGADATVDGERMLLVRPRSFMNVSGPPIAGLVRKRDVALEHLVVVHDEIDLSFGSLKVKLGGGTAGHNGLRSVVGALGSGEFVRVRLGVGRPPGRKDPADYVLEPFAKAEREEAGVLVEEAADAVLTVVREGVAAAQDRHNRTG